MGALSSILRSQAGGRVAFWCPGCDEAHAINVEPEQGRPCWGYNGNAERPTFTPSIKVESVQIERDAGGEWTGEWIMDADGKALPSICHSFVTDGRIQFLGDCTHALAGQTVDLPPFHGDDDA